MSHWGSVCRIAIRYVALGFRMSHWNSVCRVVHVWLSTLGAVSCLPIGSAHGDSGMSSQIRPVRVRRVRTAAHPAEVFLGYVEI